MNSALARHNSRKGIPPQLPNRLFPPLLLQLMIPTLVVMTLVTHNFLAYVFLVAVAGNSVAVLYLLPW